MGKNVIDTKKFEMCRKSSVSKYLNAMKDLFFCDKIDFRYYPQKSVILCVLEQCEFEKNWKLGKFLKYFRKRGKP